MFCLFWIYIRRILDKLALPSIVWALVVAGCASVYAGRVRVIEVFDGDTVLLDNRERVRYLGIDAPEIEGPGGSPEPLALEAKQRNRQLVLGRIVRLRQDTVPWDRYGRRLAYVFLQDGTMVNAVLVAEGLASVLTKAPNTLHRRLLVSRQRAAMEARLGLWHRLEAGGEPYYLGNRRSTVFHRPDCPFGRRTPAHRRVRFSSRHAAFWAGYSPCKRCRP